jgi:hypothetical protein
MFIQEKVIHLDVAIHKKAKDYCNKEGLKLKDWVEKLIYKRLYSEGFLTEGETSKHLRIYPEPKEDLATLPPFWNREKGNDL